MSRSRLLICLLALLMALGLFWQYQTLAREFSFDFIWDMDSSATQDALLINSGHPPAHLDHPKYVMAVVQAAEASLMRATGLSSTASLADLAVSPQPMLGFAELTDKLRSAHALSAWLLLVLMVGLLWRLFPALPVLALLALPLLGLQSGLLYNAMTMRSELYSPLLVVIGMWLVLELWQPGKTPSLWRQRLTILMLGVLTGLALLNKIQAISLFFVLPAFAAFCYLRWQPADAERSEAETIRFDRVVVGLFAGCLVLFALITGLALTAPVLPGRTVTIINAGDILSHLPGSLAKLKMQVFWLGFIASGLLALLLSRRLKTQRWVPALKLYPLFPAGAMLACLLPMLSLLGKPDGLYKSWIYTANLMRSAVWLDASLLSQSGNTSRQTLSYLIQHRPDLLLLTLAALILLALSARQDTAERRLQLSLCAVIGACLLTLLLGNRPLLRDTLWYEVWCSWAGLLGLGQFLSASGQKQTAQQGRPALRWLLLAVVAGVALNSLMLAPRERESFYVYHAPYGFDGGPYNFMTQSVYLHQDNPYHDIFKHAFGDDALITRRAIAQARDWRDIQRRLGHPFVNAEVPLRNVGLLDEGFPAWQRKQQWARFERIPDELQGSAFVALGHIRPYVRNRQYFNDFNAEGLQGKPQIPGAPMLTAVTSFNYSLLIALPEADLQAQGLVSGPEPKLQSLTVNEQGQSVAYRLFQLEDADSLDQRKLAQLSAPPLGIVYSHSVHPPDLPVWPQELSRWLGAD